MLLPQTELVRVLGDRTAKSFAKHLGLLTVADLLQHYPRRYGTRGELTPLFDLPIGESVSVVADVVQVQERRMKGKSGSILEVRITDGHGFISLTDDSDVLYVMGEAYAGRGQGVRWNDPAFGIKWPREPTTISAQDAAYPDFQPAP